MALWQLTISPSSNVWDLSAGCLSSKHSLNFCSHAQKNIWGGKQMAVLDYTKILCLKALEALCRQA